VIVELAAVRDAPLVLPTFAHALGLVNARPESLPELLDSPWRTLRHCCCWTTSSAMRSGGAGINT